jgi:N-carbamoyl-L-amino-acid hydrolase
MEPHAIARAVEARLPFAESLFNDLYVQTRDQAGVTRPAWSPQDQRAADLVTEAARSLDLEVSYDPAGNLYATLPGKDRTGRGILTGSHLDSVPKGGNYDGAAGVVAGLTALAVLQDLGITPETDMTMVGLRGEESVWYGIAYVGSRLAVGSLPVEELDQLRRGDTGLSLGEHMAALGYEVEALKQATTPWISPANTRAYLELHIEQGPVLISDDLPVAIPTTIRGNVRFPYARCLGTYAHSAAVPRAHRHDAVLAVVELVTELERFWVDQEAAGVPDTVFTVGKLSTNAAQHAMTKVPGECDFTLNFGGTTRAFLDAARARMVELSAQIAAKRRVAFQLGNCVGSDPTPLDHNLRGVLRNAADALGIASCEMATVGHDASIFARAGIPAAMILIRNQHGSHNPHEAMELSDFGLGTQILVSAMLELGAS